MTVCAHARQRQPTPHFPFSSFEFARWSTGSLAAAAMRFPAPGSNVGRCIRALTKVYFPCRSRACARARIIMI
jgi:hypothetical protein